MSIYDKIMTVCLAWLVVSMLCNPWFENKRLRYVSLGLAAIITVTFMVQP